MLQACATGEAYLLYSAEWNAKAVILITLELGQNRENLIIRRCPNLTRDIGKEALIVYEESVVRGFLREDAGA